MKAFALYGDLGAFLYFFMQISLHGAVAPSAAENCDNTDP